MFLVVGLAIAVVVGVAAAFYSASGTAGQGRYWRLGTHPGPFGIW